MKLVIYFPGAEKPKKKRGLFNLYLISQKNNCKIIFFFETFCLYLYNIINEMVPAKKGLMTPGSAGDNLQNFFFKTKRQYES